MSDSFIHPTAIVDAGATLGEGTKVWHWAHISAGARIGTGCSFGQNVYVGNDVVIGNNVKVQNNVSVYDAVRLEDDVFCGPSMVFTNVHNPRSAVVRKHEYRATTVKKGATLGANCTIVCGVMIGTYAFVGAGAVVTRDVRDFGLVAGNPARQLGWMSAHGIRLQLPLAGDAEAICSESGVPISATRRCMLAGREDVMTKIVTIVGARPQFIKAAAISRAIARPAHEGLQEVLVHTGQHYDENMSKVFFDELDIPRPAYNLEIGGGSHGAMTGRMLEAIEKVLLLERPQWVLIYGDTNSTLAGALAAAKLHIPTAHVEAGLRSFNTLMPEEINRILSDRVSSLLFCPTRASVENLRAEGISRGVHEVGDVMYDVCLFYNEQARRKSTILQRLELAANTFILATCHRAENTDDPERLAGIIDALATLAKSIPVVWPLHPRSRQVMKNLDLIERMGSIITVEPLAYLDMLALEQSARVICTDSGGVQKEAYFFGVPCVTMREETEWVELVSTGWNQLAGADTDRIVAAVERGHQMARSDVRLYGDGHAAEKILTALVRG